MTTYWTADQHFLHEAIIKHCNRPFKNFKEQTKVITAKHNSVVSPADTVCHIGDVFWGGAEYKNQFKKILSKLNGTHILILGNHDELRAMDYIWLGFQSAHTSLVISYHNYRVVMAHDPAVWNVVDMKMYKNTIFLHAHSHRIYRSIRDKRIVNVGVDVWDFYPVSFDKILKVLKIEK